MREILESYKLLFSDSPGARKLYRQTLRASAARDGVVDSRLDDLCGFKLSDTLLEIWRPTRETYHATDFPILRYRLGIIHNYVEGIQPNRLMSIWRDRRDLKLWFTIWAVLVFGAINIIQSFISIGLSAAQLQVARDAYQLQELQGSDS